MNRSKEARKRLHRGIGLICGIISACLLGIFAPRGGENAQAKQLAQGSENYRYVIYKAGDIEVKVHIGLSGNMIRSGRYAPVHLILKNNGKDFEGSFRFYLNSQDMEQKERNIVEKKIQIAGGETKEYSLLIACESDVQTALCDKKGKPVDEKHFDKQLVTVGEFKGGTPFLGCLSEDKSSLDYLADPELIQVEDLQDWMFTGDARMLDMFDILVMNQFDTTQFSEKQIAAVNEWVSQGGTLILGTGSQPEKTLKAFSGTLLQGTIGNSKRISTQFGTDLDISELQIENMKSILTQDQDMLVGTMDYGRGRVMVAAFDLAAAGDKLADNLQSLVYVNMGTDRKEELMRQEMLQQNDTMDSMNIWDEFSLSKGLNATEVNGLPNIALYAVILLLYAALIGPLLYSIMRKRGKREWLWGLIPASAVVFSVMIYLIGTGTRVRHPFINYLSCIDLSSKENATLQTYMSVTSPNNDPFEMEASGKDIVPYRVNNYYYRDDTASNLDYQCRLEYAEDKTSLHFDNMGSFEHISFRQRQEAPQKGRVQFTDLNLNYGEFGGIVTNQSGYDLEQCVLICNNAFLCLGELKQGESVALDQLEDSAWVQDLGNYDSIAERITGYENVYNHNDVQGLRRTVMLNRQYSVDSSHGEYYFYGFLAPNQETTFTEQYDVDLYGETAVVQCLNEEDLGKETTEKIAYLDVFEQEIPNEIKNGNGLSQKEYKISYHLGSVGALDSLQLGYYRSENSEFEVLDLLQGYFGNLQYVEQIFMGKVFAVNQKTGKPEELFQAGQENVVTDLAKYLDQQGNLELIYQVEVMDMVQYPDAGEYFNTYCLPKLILERRKAQ